MVSLICFRKSLAWNKMPLIKSPRKKKTRMETPSLLFNERGEGKRRTVLLMALAGLAGLGGFFFFKLYKKPGAADVWEHGSAKEKMDLLKSVVTGEPVPQEITERFRKEEAAQEKIDSFEARLARIRRQNSAFLQAEKILSTEAFHLKNAARYIHGIRTYLETLFGDYQFKKNIPWDLLAWKINGFPEKRIFAILACCCGLPDDNGLNFVASSLFKNIFADLEGRSRAQADYHLKVIDSVIYLRADWYKNLMDENPKDAKTSEALETVWNFLNANELPQDLVKNKMYFTSPEV